MVKQAENDHEEEVNMTYKILYIEDNADNMRLIRKVLGADGHKVLGAANGLDGISMAEEIKPDLILVDINLPDIDGYEVARRIRSSKVPNLQSVVMIAITANVLAGDAEKALDAGCDAYLPKPVNVRELSARVGMYLSKKAD
jgi:two-component system cell cycle response regulator DivK